MSLYTELQKASSEEDVKKTYIKAFGLSEKQFSMNLFDIHTDTMWFESKFKGTRSVAQMYGQLFHYLDMWIHPKSHKGSFQITQHNRVTPSALTVIDQEKAAIIPVSDIMVLFEDSALNKQLRERFGKNPSASSVTPDLIEFIEPYIKRHYVEYNIQTQAEEFVQAVKTVLKHNDFLRTDITPANVRKAFDLWVKQVGVELEDKNGNPVAEKDYAVLFFADVMHDAHNKEKFQDLTMSAMSVELMFKGDSPVFLFNGKLYTPRSTDGYRNFWQIYHRPPKEKHRKTLLSRRDILLPLNEQAFKGAFFTPLLLVEKAYDLLGETLGEDWQEEYIVWDMCCGVGNLETKHSNPRNVYMSTLDQADIDIMNTSKTIAGAVKFQYDYLNDDIAADGSIDYSLTNKVPLALQKAIKDGKKILVLINPPYAEAGAADNASRDMGKEKSKAKNKVSRDTMVGALMRKNYGMSRRELFAQFMVRTSQEIPQAKLSIFSTLKIVNAPNFEEFRNQWKAKFLDGFMVRSKVFDGLKGEFPIGFCIWDQAIKDDIEKITLAAWDSDLSNKSLVYAQTKDFNKSSVSSYLNEWVIRPKADKDLDVIPLKNAISPATKTIDVRGTKWSKNAIGHMWCDSNDVQHANHTVLFSSGYNGAGSFFVNPDNMWQAAIIFAVRRVIKPTWINDRDQFLQPTEPLTQEFKDDCLAYMLFHGSNLSASANNLEWNNKKWSIVNHFIPFTEAAVNASGRFESSFMVDYIADKKFSQEAQAVLDAGKSLWQLYFSKTDEKAVRDAFKLNRSDVGWYQIRNSLKRRGDVSFTEFDAAFAALAEKLRPQVYTLGFLKP